LREVILSVLWWFLVRLPRYLSKKRPVKWRLELIASQSATATTLTIPYKPTLSAPPPSAAASFITGGETERMGGRGDGQQKEQEIKAVGAFDYLNSSENSVFHEIPCAGAGACAGRFGEGEGRKYLPLHPKVKRTL
jgi:hypothetical protein